MTEPRYVPPTDGQPADIEEAPEVEYEPLPFDMQPAEPLEQIRFLGDLAKINLLPGDVCVLMTEQPLTADAADRIRATFRAAFGDEIKCLVLGPELKLGVLSPQAPARCSECDGSRGMHKTNCPLYRP